LTTLIIIHGEEEGMVPGFAAADVETIASIMYKYTGAVCKAVSVLHVRFI